MSDQNNDLFITLVKILQRSGLNANSLPTDLSHWQEFIKRINNFFVEADRGHYLLERSMEISSREFRELTENLIKTQSSMITLSKQAGMSEIATSVLHNVGNILNSINLSVSTIEEIMNDVEIEDLAKVSQMINENLSNHDFLISHPKGKLIPDYLTKLSEILITSFKEIHGEIENLNRNVSHVKDIVVMQKDISGISGVKEKVFLTEVIDLAIKMAGDFHKYGITLIKNYNYSTFIIIDKSKLLQILVNLIKNAKESLELAKKIMKKKSQ